MTLAAGRRGELLGMSVQVRGEALPVTPGHRRVIVNIPEMTAIPRRLRFPGGAAGLAGPVGPWMSRTKSGHCSLASSGWPEDRQSCE